MPYGIEFLGKDWDSHTGVLELWQECLRVLKPGGYILAFSAARTYHQLASNIELAGFEIRDQLMWLYASGFPKAQDIGKAIDKRNGKVDENHLSMPAFIPITGDLERPLNRCPKCNKGQAHITVCDDSECVRKYTIQSDVGKQYAGWKTATKPAHEPIVMARKPFKGSTIDNVLKNGLGAMNIDATRVPWADEVDEETSKAGAEALSQYTKMYDKDGGPEIFNTLNKTRKKSDREIAMTSKAWGNGRTDDSASDGSPTFCGEYKKKKSDRPNGSGKRNEDGSFTNRKVSNLEFGDGMLPPVTYDPEAISGRYPSNVIGEVEEGYQKYFYCPKVSRKERHIGFEAPPSELLNSPGEMKDHPLWDPSIGTNSHRLMQKIRAAQQVETTAEAVASVGGYKVNEVTSFIPGLGVIYDHGVKHEVEKIRKAQGIVATNIGNNHPTVKPVALMDYLIKLVTPPSTPTLQRKVLDPFMGSGSTGMAATALGHHFTGCELDPKYVAIAETRIDAWLEPEPEKAPAANDQPIRELPSELWG